jgi:hypothetical protein
MDLLFDELLFVLEPVQVVVWVSAVTTARSSQGFSFRQIHKHKQGDKCARGVPQIGERYAQTYIKIMKMTQQPGTKQTFRRSSSLCPFALEGAFI